MLIDGFVWLFSCVVVYMMHGLMSELWCCSFAGTVSSVVTEACLKAFSFSFKTYFIFYIRHFYEL